MPLNCQINPKPFMSSGICTRAAVAIKLNIRKMRELAELKLKGINKSPLTYFLMVLMYSLTACKSTCIRKWAMHIGFLNPQGNFDSGNSHITKHPDFGGQLIYVKQVAIAIAQKGHKVDILTRQIIDPEWPEFAEAFDTYSGVDNVRIIRLPAGPKEFLPKELLWPHLVNDWVPNILKFYQQQGGLPDAMTAHYSDGGLCGVLIEEETGIPFTFTAHSLWINWKLPQRICQK